MRLLRALVSSLAIAGVSSIPHSSVLGKRCVNSPADRSCWSDAFDISTDYYTSVPDTGETVEIWLELTNSTAALDGVSRNALLVNGTFPGPTIIANWGDTVVVHLYNGLENNGTGLHFHGIRQNYTNEMDGVPSVTQCPVAPGESITYTWRATQYGSTWYHSHFALQAWEGVLGGIIINGPSTANYDVDLGSLFLNDWSHQTVDALYESAQTSRPPTLDNGLINGTNVYDELGSRFNTTFSAGESYRIRLINGAIDTHFKFSIDNHNITVIATDLVPIVPYSTQVLSIGIGQRYDIIVNASQTSGNYWMRAIPQTFCSDNDSRDNIKGIVKYDSSNSTEPDTDAWDLNLTDNCDDEDVTNLVPYLSQTVGAESVEDEFEVTINKLNNVFKWYLAATTFVSPWEDPTVLQLYNGDTNYTTSSHVIELNNADEWVYFIIETTQNIPHPIHLHGHDFFILSQTTGTYVDGTTTLNLVNPPRRDVAMLPAGGHLVIAFQTDNPGAWLMHCHIGWHTGEGFALQLVERASEIVALMNTDTLLSTCAAWNAYTSSDSIEQLDSGI